jgi:hypothetical protein
MFHGARILVAPLDWGLGHATRCIPIISRLIDLGAVPVIGADRGPLALLRREFPGLEYAVLPGPVIRYGGGRQQLWSMALQFPSMVRSVSRERAQLRALRGRMRLHAVISDQRFGLRDPAIPSVVLTHQVFPFTPAAQGFLRRINRGHLSAFTHCWVVDHQEGPGLAGELSHGSNMPRNARYIGTLSRMRPDAPPPPVIYDVVAVISGPEPQRTLLEQRLLEQLQHIKGHHLLVRGMPGSTEERRMGNVHAVAHMGGDELNAHLVHAGRIITRSGYTTLMDLEAIGRQALLIPTPGQPEQEYLGRLHAPLGVHVVRPQEQLRLTEALDGLPLKGTWRRTRQGGRLDEALRDLAASLH